MTTNVYIDASIEDATRLAQANAGLNVALEPLDTTFDEIEAIHEELLQKARSGKRAEQELRSIKSVIRELHGDHISIEDVNTEQVTDQLKRGKYHESLMNAVLDHQLTDDRFKPSGFPSGSIENREFVEEQIAVLAAQPEENS